MSVHQLTKSAQLKYADLRDGVEEAFERVLSLQRRVSETTNQIRNFSNETQAEQRAPYEAELARQQAKLGQEQARHAGLARVCAAVTAWITTLSPAVELQDAPEVKYELEPGELPVEAVQRIREDYEQLSARRTKAARSLLPSHDICAQIETIVDALAEQGRPNFSVVDDKLSVSFAVEGYADRAIALLAWMDPEVVKSQMRLSFSQYRRREFARGLTEMSRDERIATLADLDGRILALEREEEFFVCLAVDEGMTIHRREGANPEAVLGVVVARKARVKQEETAA